MGAFSQVSKSVYNSFHLKSKVIYWSRVFDQPGFSADDLQVRMLAHLGKNEVIHHVRVDELGNIVADISKMKINYKKWGVPFIHTSNKISNGIWKGKIKIEFSEEKYRISIYDLEYVAKINTFRVPKSVTGSKTFERGALGESFLNRDKVSFKKSSLRDLDLMNIFFVDQFSLIPERMFDPDMMMQSSSY
jgi:hypothetical protein